MSTTGDSKLSRSEFMKREMTKFTDIQKGYLKQFMGDCLMNRFTTEESLLYLKDRLGVELEEDEFDYLKVHLKRDLKRNMDYLRRHEYAYVQEYFDRIEEMRLISKRLWTLVEENPHNPILQKDCLSELCKSTVAVANFYQSIRDLDQTNVTSKEESDAANATGPETTSIPPTVETGEAMKVEPPMISASHLESPQMPPKVETGEAMKEEPPMISASDLESTPTPVAEIKTSEAPKEEVDTTPSSPETTPTPPPEVEIPQQFSPKKIARYTSEGKPVTD